MKHACNYIGTDSQFKNSFVALDVVFQIASLYVPFMSDSRKEELDSATPPLSFLAL